MTTQAAHAEIERIMQEIMEDESLTERDVLEILKHMRDQINQEIEHLEEDESYE